VGIRSDACWCVWCWIVLCCVVFCRVVLCCVLCCVVSCRVVALLCCGVSTARIREFVQLQKARGTVQFGAAHCISGRRLEERQKLLEQYVWSWVGLGLLWFGAGFCLLRLEPEGDGKHLIACGVWCVGV
jgi:hypothetical protein